MTLDQCHVERGLLIVARADSHPRRLRAAFRPSPADPPERRRAAPSIRPLALRSDSRRVSAAVPRAPVVRPRLPRAAEYFSWRSSNGCPLARFDRAAHSQVPRGQRRPPDEEVSSHPRCARRAARDCDRFPPSRSAVRPAAAQTENIELRMETQQILGDSVLTVVFGEQEGALTCFVGGFEQCRIAGKRRAHGRQIAFLDAFLECFHVWHLKPPAEKFARPCSVPNRDD